jgi:AraC family transcriptional regulator
MNNKFNNLGRYSPKERYVQVSHLQLITEGSKLINDGQNRMYYAELYEFFSKDAFRNFSIKIPIEGTVIFKTAQREFELQPNSFLLSYRQPGKVTMDSSTLIRSFSIDIKKETIEQALKLLAASGKYDLAGMQADYFFSPDFFENVYSSKCKLGKELNSLVQQLLDNSITLSEATFLSVAQKVIIHELENYKSLNKLTSIRTATKKELLKRLLKGKDFIDEHFLGNPAMTDIVKHSNMSEFHFFRSFKQAFGCSPYQYMMKKRLEHATVLIGKDETFTTVALKCGFPDLFTFSKAFKRAYGTSPSSYKSNEAFSPQI